MREKYIRSQKNLPTRLLARRQLAFIDRYISGDILDVGCGDGIIGAIYGATSCDIADNNKFGISVDIAPGESLPYPDDSFDTACSIGVIEHTDDPHKVIAESRRVLRPHGKLIITYPEGIGWPVLRKMLRRPSIDLHADFRMNGEMSEWKQIAKTAIIPGFFVGEVYMVISKSDQMI